VVVPKDYDDWEYSREYFYHDKQLYFAFVYNKSEEYRFYFQNGVLIRYIDTDGNIFDYGDLDDYSMEKRVKNESDSLFPTMINCGD
jgi:serine/threonine-protein kinase